MIYKQLFCAITFLWLSVAANDITRLETAKEPFVFDVNNIDDKYFTVKV